MAKFIYELDGVCGRVLKIYDTKCVIETKPTIGSFITDNAMDGIKTIFYIDVVGVQFFKSVNGYLQFETSSSQMNNIKSNFYSENTFTYRVGKNGISDELMEAVYQFVVDRIEEIKYGTKIIENIPDFERMKNYRNIGAYAVGETADVELSGTYDDEGYIDMRCPYCREKLSVNKYESEINCPWCGIKIKVK